MSMPSTTVPTRTANKSSFLVLIQRSNDFARVKTATRQSWRNLGYLEYHLTLICIQLILERDRLTSKTQPV